MRVAMLEREKKAAEAGLVAGVIVKWVLGSSFPSEKTWQKTNSEAVAVKIARSLFADDTSIVGNRKELEQGVRVTKEVMADFEERNNDDKEEKLVFSAEDSGSVRIRAITLSQKFQNL